MMDPSNPLGELMQTAVKMKGAAQEKLRTNFDSWPRYYQNSMFMQESVIKLRDEIDFDKKFDGAIEFKNKGNEFFKQGEYDEANAQYEKALSVFKYCLNMDPNWKNKGIKDESLKQFEYQCDNQQERERLNQLMISCYLNISMCQFKLKEYRLCLPPCDDALKIDPNNAKAYYRRALAIITPPSAGATEYDIGIKELQKAYEADPSDHTIRKLLRELKQDQKYQKEKDKKQFTGMFERGTIVNEEEIQTNKSKSSTYSSNMDLNDEKRFYGMTDEEKFHQKVRECEIAIKLYEERGEINEANKIRENLIRAKEIHEKKKIKMDFLNPTEEMIQDAKKNGIDLTDKRVQKMLQELQEEKEQEENGNKNTNQSSNETKKPIPVSSAAANPTKALVDSMNHEQLIQFAKAEGIEYTKYQSIDELRNIVYEILNSRYDKNNSNSLNESSKEKELNWKWIFIIIGLWMFYRLYSAGLLQSLIYKILPIPKNEYDNPFDQKKSHSSLFYNDESDDFFDEL